MPVASSPPRVAVDPPPTHARSCPGTAGRRACRRARRSCAAPRGCVPGRVRRCMTTRTDLSVGVALQRPTTSTPPAARLLPVRGGVVTMSAPIRLARRAPAMSEINSRMVGVTTNFGSERRRQVGRAGGLLPASTGPQHAGGGEHGIGSAVTTLMRRSSVAWGQDRPARRSTGRCAPTGDRSGRSGTRRSAADRHAR